LSITDIKVLALTLQLEWEKVGRDHLRLEPYSMTIERQKTQDQAVPIQNSEKKKNRRKRKPKKNIIQVATDEIAQIQLEDNGVELKDSNEFLDNDQELEDIEEELDTNLEVDLVQERTETGSVLDMYDDSSDDGGEWITPSNVTKKKALEGLNSSCIELGDDPASMLKVACVTNDFAMQVKL
jgi:rRNA maturation endonuclease Nob1